MNPWSITVFGHGKRSFKSDMRFVVGAVLGDHIGGAGSGVEHRGLLGVIICAARLSNHKHWG